MSDLTNAVTSGFSIGQAAGGRFSGLNPAVQAILDRIKQKQDQQDKLGLLGAEGLIKGTLTPAGAKEGQTTTMSIPGIQGDVKSVPQMTGVYDPDTGQIQYSVPKGSKSIKKQTGVLSNKDLESAAQLIASGKEVPSQISGFSKQRQQIIDRAVEINPNFDPRQAELAFKSSSSMMTDSKVQDTKVNLANNLMTILNKGYDSKNDNYTVSPSQHYELALGYAKMVSPQGVVAQQTADELRQRTAQEGLAGAAIYLGVDPKIANGPPQNLIKFFRDNIDNQAKDALETRGNYSQGQLTDYVGIQKNGQSNYKPIKSSQTGTDVEYQQYLQATGQ